MRSMPFALAVLLTTSAGAVPTTITYAGVLTDGDVPVNGTVNVTFTLFDDAVAGTERYSEDVTGLVILEGELIAELGANALDDALLDLPELYLEVTVDGTPLLPRVRLNSVPYALRAEAALRAEEALTFGGLLPTDVVTDAQLATLGLQNGLIAGTGITVTAGTIAITAGGVTNTQLAPNSVNAANIVDGSVGTAEIGVNGVGASEIADGSVGSGEIGDGSIATQDIADDAVGVAKIKTPLNVFVITAIGCVDDPNTLSLSNLCQADTVGCSGGQCRACANNVCGTCSAPQCANAGPVGFLVGSP